MQYIEIGLLILLVICGFASCLNKNLMISVIIIMAFSVIMSVIWAMLEAPDLAITEAAVGAGISSILFFITLLKLKEIDKHKDDENHK